MTDKQLVLKFSHNYVKLGPDWINHSATLLHTLLLQNLESIDNDFLDYDCKYYEDGRPQYYPLEKNKPHLELVFLLDNGRVFTTFRPANRQSKIEYYQTSVGKTFKLVKEEKP